MIYLYLLKKLQPHLLPSFQIICTQAFNNYYENEGDKGQPYLNPLMTLKKLDGNPLMRTMKESQVKYLIIHFTKEY